VTRPNPIDKDDFTSQEFDEAYELAKRALGFVGKFRTPPTPTVYELWYRFVEGKNEALKEQMAFLVNDSKTATRSQLESLQKQFIDQPDESQQRTAEELVASVSGIESMIRSQAAAGVEFDNALSETNQKLVGQDQSPDDLKQCVVSVLASNSRMQLQLKETKQQLDDSQLRMEKLRANLALSQKLMLTDPLTEIGNRRFFDMMIKQFVDKRSQGNELSVLLLVDLDNFKAVNDSHGHDSGDIVIQFVAGELKKVALSAEKVASDVELARYGGDEFAIFAKTDSHDSGKQFADSIVESISKKNLTLTKTGEVLGRIGISVGAAYLRPEDTSISWFDRADKLLYSAKTGGRNMVMIERKVA